MLLIILGTVIGAIVGIIICCKDTYGRVAITKSEKITAMCGGAIIGLVVGMLLMLVSTCIVNECAAAVPKNAETYEVVSVDTSASNGTTKFIMIVKNQEEYDTITINSSQINIQAGEKATLTTYSLKYVNQAWYLLGMPSLSQKRAVLTLPESMLKEVK